MVPGYWLWVVVVLAVVGYVCPQNGTTAALPVSVNITTAAPQGGFFGNTTAQSSGNASISSGNGSISNIDNSTQGANGTFANTTTVPLTNIPGNSSNTNNTGVGVAQGIPSNGTGGGQGQGIPFNGTGGGQGQGIPSNGTGGGQGQGIPSNGTRGGQGQGIPSNGTGGGQGQGIPSNGTGGGQGQGIPSNGTGGGQGIPSNGTGGGQGQGIPFNGTGGGQGQGLNNVTVQASGGFTSNNPSGFTTPSVYYANDPELLAMDCSPVGCPPRSECVDYVDVNVTKKGCRCDTSSNYTIAQNKLSCFYPAQLQDRCGGGSICQVPYSQCVNDGSNENIHRCKCSEGFTDLVDAQPRVCARILTVVDDPTCQSCELNEGVCYNTDGDHHRDGCKCKASRSGTDCEKIHVTVKCNWKQSTMTVCYEPHVGMNMTNGGKMAVSVSSNLQSCKGRPAPPNDTICSAGSYKLILSMANGLRDTCGTKKLPSDGSTEKYENKISVSNNDNTRRVVFKTYCNYVTATHKSFSAVSVLEINGNNRGEDMFPTLRFVILNTMLQPLPTNTYVQVGEKIRFQISVTKDDTYAAMSVRQCTASDSPSISDPFAKTEVLITNGCPASNQKRITMGNNFKPMKNQTTGIEMLSGWRTGFVRAFKVSGNALYVHCKIKLCLVGDAISCQKPVCTGRRRRAAADDATKTADVTTSLRVGEESSWAAQERSQQLTEATVSMSLTGFVVLLTILIAMLIISMAITVLMYFRFRRKHTVSDILELTETGKPQRFALPRVNQTHMRL